MEQKDMYYNKAEYIETVSVANYSHNPLKWSINTLTSEIYFRETWNYN